LSYTRDTDSLSDQCRM